MKSQTENKVKDLNNNFMLIVKIIPCPYKQKYAKTYSCNIVYRINIIVNFNINKYFELNQYIT